MPTPPCPDDGALLGFLAEGDDPGGLRDHVEGCAECRGRRDVLGGLIGTFRRLAPADLPGPPVRPGPPAPCHPSVLGKFFVLKVRRDREGEAVVSYVGVHRHVHQSGVILHLARASSAKDEAAIEAVTAACKPLTRLNHPGIARAIDVGAWEDRPFLAVEDAPGVGLEDALKTRRFTATEAARITANLARALASAHREGLAHGALSPSSIVVDHDGRPTLIDFGVAHLTGRGPEGHDADDRARDISALGAILGLLSGGNPPIKGLERARARAMDTDPARRYADAEEFARALEKFSGGGRPLPRVFAAAALILTIAVGLWWAWRVRN